MRQTLGSLMAMLAQQRGTTAAPLPEPSRQVALAISAGQELGNGIKAVPGEEAGVRNETATSAGTTRRGEGTVAGARSGAGRRSELVTSDSRETWMSETTNSRPTRNERLVEAYCPGGACRRYEFEWLEQSRGYDQWCSIIIDTQA